MTTTDHYCSLEQSKKLKALGVTQIGSLTFHKEYPDLGETAQKNTSDEGMEPCLFNRSFGRVLGLFENEWAAFSVSELGIMIDWSYVAVTPPSGQDKKWTFFTDDDDFSNEIEAHGRADVLICLLEQKTITAQEVNDRINDADFMESISGTTLATELNIKKQNTR